MEVQSTTDTSTSTVSTSTGDAFANLDMDDFIQLMITELQNQDPLNPMDNTQMLEQIGQIREISSNDKLTDTLESLMLGQGVSTAGSMIGQKVSGLSDASVRVEGIVNRVLIENGEAKLIVTETVPETTDPATGKTIAEHTVDHTVSVKNVSEILDIEEDAAEEPAEIPASDDLPQRLAVAQELIGQSIVGISDENYVVSGDVVQVSMESGSPLLVLEQEVALEDDSTQIVEHHVALNKVSAILSDHVDTFAVVVDQ